MNRKVKLGLAALAVVGVAALALWRGLGTTLEGTAVAAVPQDASAQPYAVNTDDVLTPAAPDMDERVLPEATPPVDAEVARRAKLLAMRQLLLDQARRDLQRRVFTPGVAGVRVPSIAYEVEDLRFVRAGYSDK